MGFLYFFVILSDFLIADSEVARLSGKVASFRQKVARLSGKAARLIQKVARLILCANFPILYPDLIIKYILIISHYFIHWFST
ncbi:hypothetical protein [Ureibacillus aquaedulcis]|uniref:Uncharacterized protein n=1 Tax=Ureibacillus aquaedulcis TaxID=3058421 RepID=A0ABT8GV32_9BACL|nr:hypothetical protein [Ureibacillus sp. BA0131]MDN4494756.1 hypothetical protein [Ureibacillus sp. BA0131]